MFKTRLRTETMPSQEQSNFVTEVNLFQKETRLLNSLDFLPTCHNASKILPAEWLLLSLNQANYPAN